MKDFMQGLFPEDERFKIAVSSIRWAQARIVWWSNFDL